MNAQHSRDMPQLYARVFVSILDSSLASDWKVRHVFEDLLKLAFDGVVDMTRDAIARRLNMPFDVVDTAINQLESPDPTSRDQDNEGRRLLRLDDHRNWGWLISNWDKYEEIRSLADQRAANRSRVSRCRSKKEKEAKRKNPDPSPDPDPERPLQNITDHYRPLQTITSPLQTITVDDIYDAYPKKIGRGAAIQKIQKAIKDHRKSPEWLLERTKQYAEAVSRWPVEDRQYIPNPETWFNQQRYLDDDKEWQRGGSVVPAFRRIELVEQEIATHPANPEFRSYLPERVTEQMKLDLDVKRKQLYELRKEANAAA
jgi:hypothetical protein